MTEFSHRPSRPSRPGFGGIAIPTLDSQRPSSDTNEQTLRLLREQVDAWHEYRESSNAQQASMQASIETLRADHAMLRADVDEFRAVRQAVIHVEQSVRRQSALLNQLNESVIRSLQSDVQNARDDLVTRQQLNDLRVEMMVVASAEGGRAGGHAGTRRGVMGGALVAIIVPLVYLLGDALIRTAEVAHATGH